MDNEAKHSYDFGPFRLDAGERLLLREGEPVRLTRKAFETLCVLIQNSGRVIEKDEFMRSIWPDVYIEETTLAQNIFTLRRALGDNLSEHRYIETVPKRGYRFVAKVNVHSSEYAENRSGNHQNIASIFRSIAILPFKLLFSDNTSEYFGLGMADALITKLSNVRKVIVRPTSAIIRYKDLEQEPTIAGMEMKVGLVLEGKIQKFDNKIRVTIQLINVEFGATLWADKFDGEFEDIFSVQDMISEQIVEAMILKFSKEWKKSFPQKHRRNGNSHKINTLTK
jgi:DNA-binding winged helix-turn-helix (wHTH) protein